MRLPLLIAITMIAVNVVVDLYIYFILRQRCHSRLPARIQAWTAAALFAMAVVAISLPRRGGDNGTLITVMWMLYGYLSVYLAKYAFTAFDLVSLLPGLLRRRRWRFMSVAGVAASVVVFLAMWWGAFVERFRIDVREAEVGVAGLPAAFDGLRVAQISDLHVGTFGSDTSFVSRLVDRVNSLRPDVIFFTGDIVNSRTSELSPHVKPLSRLEAPLGVYSILGNHDYGDYADWPGEHEKADNLLLMKALQKQMGWRLLLNETVFLRRGGDSIAVIGVENIGDPPFRVYGSLATAYPSLSDSVCKLLLTHNPAHWTDSIAGNPLARIPLSLSGHTHAMQIELAGWSPAAWRYPTWGGLYHDSDSTHTLYVNIGSGTVGFPSRIGATPEITILTLKNL